VSLLTPPDLKQCQAEITPSHGFMRLGPRPQPERCKNKPTVLVTKNKPGKDNQRGSMTLCDGCLSEFRRRFPKDFATIQDRSLKSVPGNPHKNTCVLVHE